MVIVGRRNRLGDEVSEMLLKLPTERGDGGDRGAEPRGIDLDDFLLNKRSVSEMQH